MLVGRAAFTERGRNDVPLQFSNHQSSNRSSSHSGVCKASCTSSSLDLLTACGRLEGVKVVPGRSLTGGKISLIAAEMFLLHVQYLDFAGAQAHIFDFLGSPLYA
ncbi:hypothetical protein ATANTOWER_016041 [Ataeniobius toweri]|uniref:Uncharacterized protein n=1 Tax=Ataeniobius toweri TaxID=208326 RepID=A0ABU7AY46_9TELE|nr:hypothetical protein [Ataeniobius toweri]